MAEPGVMCCLSPLNFPGTNLKQISFFFYREDDRDTFIALTKEHMKAYPACGVTTVLDVGIPHDILREVQAYMASGGTGPRLYDLGPWFTSEGGYLNDERFSYDAMANYYPEAVKTQRDVIDRFSQFEDLEHIVGTKVFIEKGIFYYDVWPVFDSDM